MTTTVGGNERVEQQKNIAVTNDAEQPSSEQARGERLVSQLLFFSLGEIAETTQPAKPKEGTPESTLDKYLQRTIRRVTLFLTQAEYDDTIRKAKRVAAAIGVTNHTELFKALLDERDRQLS